MVTAEQVWEAFEGIPDPEIPVVSLVYLGVIRSVDVQGDHVQVEFTPTCAKISADQAILTLPDCEIYLLKTFPRLLDAVVGSNSTFISFTMDDTFPVRINGFEKDGPGSFGRLLGRHAGRYAASISGSVFIGLSRASRLRFWAVAARRNSS